MSEKIINTIDETIEIYEGYLGDLEKNIRVRGKSLGHANTEQASWYVYYDQKRVEIEIFKKWCDKAAAKAKGTLYKKYTENFSIALSERGKDNYIATDKDYDNLMSALLRLQQTCEKYKTVIEAFKVRGFALRNLTELKVHQMENEII